jgi:RNA polymerase sigma factor (sigma-70 family)
MLLRGFRARDPDLSLRFVRRFQASAYGLAFGIVRDGALAEDVAQQVFEHVWLHADTFDKRQGSLRGWLLRITHNIAIDEMRSRRPRPVAPQDVRTLVDRMTGSPDRGVPGVADTAVSAVSVRAALAALPVEQARAVVLAVGFGLTAAQVASYEGAPLGTAKYRIRAGLARLRRTPDRRVT